MHTINLFVKNYGEKKCKLLSIIVLDPSSV